MIFPPPCEETLAFLKRCVGNDFENFLGKCRIFQEFLYETNEFLNLTAIPPESFWSKHVADSVSLLLALPEIGTKYKYRICDVGCGAGLPSLILAAACPNTLITAVDSRGKKVTFVAQAAEKMGLKNIRALHARANEMGHSADYKHSFMLVTARAVADCKTLLRESTDLLSGTGRLVIYRTPSQAEPEVAELNAMKQKPPFILTDAMELPEQAGTRCFLILETRKSRTAL